MSEFDEVMAVELLAAEAMAHGLTYEAVVGDIEHWRPIGIVNALVPSVVPLPKRVSGEALGWLRAGVAPYAGACRDMRCRVQHAPYLRIINGPAVPRRPGTRPAARTRGPNWFEIRNAVSGGTAEIYIYDEIGYWGVTAQDFVRQLTALDVAEVDLRLNSPGGDAFDGIAIHNALRNHAATVTVTVDGLAASAASVIAMAGDRVVMGHGAQMMIHDASGITLGNADDMREMADLLDSMSDNIAEFYADRAGGDVSTWRDAMRAETWYNASEAIAAGLADEAAPARGSDPEPADQQVAARWDLSVFQYAGRDKAPAPGSTRSDGGKPRRQPPEQRRPAARAPESTAPATPVPAPEPSAPPVFEWDPDLFRAVVEDTYVNAPAPPQTPPAAPESEHDEPFVFDATEFRNSVLAAVREAR